MRNTPAACETARLEEQWWWWNLECEENLIQFSVIWCSFLFPYRNTPKWSAWGKKKKKDVSLNTSVPDENRHFASVREWEGDCGRWSLLFAGIFLWVPGVQGQTSGFGDVLPHNSFHWVSKELVLISASSKDLSVLQFSWNKIAREKREGLIWPNRSIWYKMPIFLRNKEVKTSPILQFSQITFFDALFNKIICCWLKHSLTCNYSYLLQNRKC